MGKKIVYTNDELVERITDVEDIRYTMNRLCYFMGNEEGRRMINELWVQEADHRRTASLGYNNGYYVGLDSVINHLVVDRNNERYANLKARSEANPEVPCNNLNLGYGCASMRTLTTPLIKEADDGRTARYMGYSLGFTSSGNPDDTADSYFLMDRIFADLVKEEDGWKIWHLIITHDHTMEVGGNYSNIPIQGWDDPIEAEFGEPDIKQTVYDPFPGWEYMYYDMPRKYYTYTEKGGYGPNSDMGKPYYIRDEH